MEACLHTDLPPPSELEEHLRNGVLLCRLASFFAPDVVPERHIFDLDMSLWKVCMCAHVCVCVCVCVFIHAHLSWNGAL